MLAGPWTDPDGATLIVLTADFTDDGVIGQSSFLRAYYAVRAFETDNFQKILITGNLPTATAMALVMEASGIPRDRIVLETRSRSTHDSAVNTAALLAEDAAAKKLVLMTSDFHMWRTQRAFRRAGLIFEPRPIPDCLKRASRWQGRWGAFQDLVAESIKIAYYWVRGWA